jgi:hypothetical protein
MRIGTKSLLIGVHQFIWHPYLVTLAWRKLYGSWPNWKELVCIFIHDWGYWGCPNMNGPEGDQHPERGSEIADFLFGMEYSDLCLCHSRYMVRKLNEYHQHLGFPQVKFEPSKLCWADKYSLWLEPDWFYLLRARLSGELAEHRELSASKLSKGGIGYEVSDREWLHHVKDYFREQALAQEDLGTGYA